MTGAEVDWEGGEAVVRYDPAVTAPAGIAGAEIFRRPSAGGRHRYRAAAAGRPPSSGEAG